MPDIDWRERALRAERLALRLWRELRETRTGIVGLSEILARRSQRVAELENQLEALEEDASAAEARAERRLHEHRREVAAARDDADAAQADIDRARRRARDEVGHDGERRIFRR